MSEDMNRINDEMLEAVTGGAEMRVCTKTTFVYVRSGPGEGFDSIYKVRNGSVVRTTGLEKKNGGQTWCELSGGGWISKSVLASA